jgi:hypothetical protein
MRATNVGDALKVKTLRRVINACVPVRGLRPMRWRFVRTQNLPKEFSFTGSPFLSAAVISSKKY